MKVTLELEAAPDVLGHLLHLGIIPAAALVGAGVAGDELNTIVTKSLDLARMDAERSWKEFAGLLAGVDVQIGTWRSTQAAGAIAPSTASTTSPPIKPLPYGYIKYPKFPPTIAPHYIDWLRMNDAAVYYAWNHMSRLLQNEVWPCLSDEAQEKISQVIESYSEKLQRNADNKELAPNAGAYLGGELPFPSAPAPPADLPPVNKKKTPRAQKARA